jgi:hypothetical protein
MRHRGSSLALAFLLAAAGSCIDGGPSGPVAGLLKVSLTTPNAGSDGAVLLTVTGPRALTSVTPATGLRVFAESLGTTNTFAVTGPLSNGPILSIGVADVSRVQDYRATIQDVAANDYTLRPLTGYSLTVAK